MSYDFGVKAIILHLMFTIDSAVFNVYSYVNIFFKLSFEYWFNQFKVLIKFDPSTDRKFFVDKIVKIWSIHNNQGFWQILLYLIWKSWKLVVFINLEIFRSLESKIIIWFFIFLLCEILTDFNVNRGIFLNLRFPPYHYLVHSEWVCLL